MAEKEKQTIVVKTYFGSSVVLDVMNEVKKKANQPRDYIIVKQVDHHTPTVRAIGKRDIKSIIINKKTKDLVFDYVSDFLSSKDKLKKAGLS